MYLISYIKLQILCGYCAKKKQTKKTTKNKKQKKTNKKKKQNKKQKKQQQQLDDWLIHKSKTLTDLLSWNSVPNDIEMSEINPGQNVLECLALLNGT